MSKENVKSPVEDAVPVGQIEIDTTKFSLTPDWNDVPVLPTRNLTMFPGVTVPLSLARPGSLELARRASESHEPVVVLCQTNPSDEMPSVSGGLYKYGVLADIYKVIELPDGSHTAILHARNRVKVLSEGASPQLSPSKISVRAKQLTDRMPADKERFEQVAQACVTTANELLEAMATLPHDFQAMMDSTRDPALCINFVATNVPIPIEAKQELLAEGLLMRRGEGLMTALLQEKQKAEIHQEIMERAASRMKDNQRSAFLQMQLDSIKEELYGGAPDSDDDASELAARADKVLFPEEARRTFDKELGRLRRLSPQTPDYSVQYAYLETLLELPWGIVDEAELSVAKAREILDTEHFGLEKVKERILEQLAVIIHGGGEKAPILCLVGPPGVGKTSLGRSVAHALGRKYQRVSLGGVHDEAEIRGHRRTYIGAMPGRIIKSLKSAGSSNPVLVLDEIDKLGADHRGDPSDALLEVLDPEQNKAFHDNYIDIDFDLSKVLFIATANSMTTVPPALLDRMEVIEISGYLLEEKMEIARRYLIPRVLADNNVAPDSGIFDITDAGLRALIERYTAESGVRRLEKMLSSLVRKSLLASLEGKAKATPIGPDDLQPMLGLAPFIKDKTDDTGLPGVVTGLAWTQVGGDILLAEASFSPAKGEKLVLTGNLGDVMKESATIALQWVRAQSDALGIAHDAFDNRQLHIHFPEGAIPKDGPSAGITIATAIASAVTGRPVSPKIAMTGEITLRGRVLPVGGVKEKILAAKRAGVTDIILSRDNERDIDEIPAEYIAGLDFHYVRTADEVLHTALK